MRKIRLGEEVLCGDLQELERVKAELEVLCSDHDRLIAMLSCQQPSDPLQAVGSKGPLSSSTGDHQVHTHGQV